MSRQTLVDIASLREDQARRELIAGWFEAYEAPLYRLALRKLGDRQLAEDLVQETFMRAFLNIPAFRGQCKALSWLGCILLHIAIDWSRRKGLKLLSQAACLDELVREPDPKSDRMSERLEYPELYELIDNMRPEMKETLARFYFHDQPIDQIAAEMKANPTTIRTRLHSCREKIRTSLQAIA